LLPLTPTSLSLIYFNNTWWRVSFKKLLIKEFRQPPFSSSVSDPNIPLSTSFGRNIRSNRTRPSLRVTDGPSQPHKTRDNSSEHSDPLMMIEHSEVTGDKFSWTQQRKTRTALRPCSDRNSSDAMSLYTHGHKHQNSVLTTQRLKQKAKTNTRNIACFYTLSADRTKARHQQNCYVPKRQW